MVATLLLCAVLCLSPCREGGSTGGSEGFNFGGFHDPFDVFKQFFGGRDPFADMFGR